VLVVGVKIESALGGAEKGKATTDGWAKQRDRNGAHYNPQCGRAGRTDRGDIPQRVGKKSVGSKR